MQSRIAAARRATRFTLFAGSVKDLPESFLDVGSLFPKLDRGVVEAFGSQDGGIRKARLADSIPTSDRKAL